MNTLFIFFLNRSFLDIVEKNKKTVFFKEFLPFLYIILNGATLIGWILHTFLDTIVQG